MRGVRPAPEKLCSFTLVPALAVVIADTGLGGVPLLTVAVLAIHVWLIESVQGGDKFLRCGRLAGGGGGCHRAKFERLPARWLAALGCSREGFVIRSGSYVMIRKRSRSMATVEQIRGARGLLGWSQPQLALAASLSEPTIKRFETGLAKVSDAAVSRMVAALEAAGVEFIAENGGGAGVRLKFRAIRPGAKVRYREGVCPPGLRNVGAVGEVLDRVAKLRGEVVVRWPSGEEAEAVADKLDVVD